MRPQAMPVPTVAGPTEPSEGFALLVSAERRWRPVSVGAKTILGTDAVPGRVVGPTVDARHCAARSEPAGIAFIDLGSRHGTWIGATPCAGRPQLATPGKVVRLGRAPVVVVRERKDRHGHWIGFGQWGSYAPTVWPVLAELALVAQSAVPALILGETGTGKEGAANAIHAASPRMDKPFVAINCAALQGDLMHAELFGAERGAYTGCTERRRGAFERADGGTLFLDEVGELSLAAQAALLRVLEVGEIQVLGGAARKVDARLVCATHRDLPRMVRDGRFRQDLWHRIAVAPVVLPPLGERREDIVPAFERFAEQVAGAPTVLDAAAVHVLQGHDWSGNFRELRNVALRAFATSCSGHIEQADVDRSIAGATGLHWQRRDAEQRLGQVRALVATGLPSADACRQSGMPRGTFYRYLKRVRAQA
ncbi:MAG: sigma 54-interacting transcriptional regulator [Deltaproteobacteria bacterium]|nr:sigma 54-interacting transcriptional regulator [Deltaproteobacteria bacterium]